MTDLKSQAIKKTIINRSFVYVLPMIALAHNIRLDDLVNFLGVFVLHKDYPQHKEHLFLHFKENKGNKKFEDLHQVFQLSRQLIFIEYPEEGEVLYCFKIPAEYKQEYDKFVQSKYSEFSENYKQCILKFHKLDQESGKDVIGVLYKKERSYQIREEEINKDLPSTHWTRIPRGQEIGYLLEEIKDRETFGLQNNN